MTEQPGEDLVRVGRIGKPHGISGGFYVDGAVSPEPFAPGSRIVTDTRDWVVATRGGTAERPLVTLEGLEDREQAAAIRGQVVRAARSAVPLEEDEWLGGDLEGLTVQDRAGRKLGAVDRLMNTPSVDVLEVSSELADASGGSKRPGPLLVPMVKDAIVEIDVAGGAITVDESFLGLGEEAAEDTSPPA